MEAHVVIAKELAYQTREDMLAAVLLHHIQPAHRVHMALDHGAHSKRRICGMLHLAAMLVTIDDVHAAQQAMVRALSAALRKKGGLIQRDHILSLLFLAARHRRGEIKQRRILIVQTDGHICRPFR